LLLHNKFLQDAGVALLEEVEVVPLQLEVVLWEVEAG
jgi:hypothetical protein